MPEGLLPTITLALAVGVAALARRGALVKRLSAVETLGSTTVICTDKTGTLTENRMRAVRVWTPLGELDLEADRTSGPPPPTNPVLALLGRAIASCSTAELDPAQAGKSRGEATEIGLLEAARGARRSTSPLARREHARRKLYRFDPTLRLMSTVDEREDGTLTVHAKGAPEEVLARCDRGSAASTNHRALTDADRAEVLGGARALRRAGPARAGGRPAAAARTAPRRRRAARTPSASSACSGSWRSSTRRGRRWPRPSRAATSAGIRIIVVTGDYGPTAAEIARRVGIARDGAHGRHRRGARAHERAGARRAAARGQAS